MIPLGSIKPLKPSWAVHIPVPVHPILEISKRIDAHDADIRPIMPIPPYDSGLSPSPPESEKEEYCGSAACCVVNYSCFLKTSQSAQTRITNLHRKIIFGDDNSIRTLGGIRNSSKIQLPLLGVVAWRIALRSCNRQRDSDLVSASNYIASCMYWTQSSCWI